MFIFYLLGNYLDSLPMTDAQFYHPKLGDVSESTVMDAAGLREPHKQGLKCYGELCLSNLLCSFLYFGFIYFIAGGFSPHGKGHGTGWSGLTAFRFNDLEKGGLSLRCV